MTSAIPVWNDISMEQLVADPYGVYRDLRRSAPVARIACTERTFVTKAKDTKFAKMNPDIFGSHDQETPMETAYRGNTLMRKDGADHQRDRTAMAAAYSASAIEQAWAPLARQIADEMLAALPGGETVDLFSTLADPFAAKLLAFVLGIEEASAETMSRWSSTLIAGAGNYAWRPEPFAATERLHEELNALIDEKCRKFLAEPNASAISAMVNADDPIPRANLEMNIKIAIGGGINEPRDALCTILFGLLTNPDQLAAVRDDARLWRDAFEEGARWVAPIQVSPRRMKQDFELDGVLLPKGERCLIIQASANHDEDVYEHGERFDIFRRSKSHQSFGVGPHFCMGTRLSKVMLADIMLPLLFERFPGMRLENPEDVVWSGFAFRGPLSLPVRLQ